MEVRHTLMTNQFCIFAVAIVLSLLVATLLLWDIYKCTTRRGGRKWLWQRGALADNHRLGLAV
ncbi:MAG: hypothetical protein COS90_05850 [Deltaproteobacteria bacterium CG07_land_8_20_14_0_80_60_11]|nr:MAG: hypothetical protein COS90_05850 [Deltaproteobacteria bacterium CG07_land_8_20_14_0_80_60_11]